MKAAAIAIALLWSGMALAQQSASYKLQEQVFNNGGRPLDGTIAQSASNRITLDAIGDSVTPGLLASASHKLGGGFVTVYPPPQEVVGLRFSDDNTMFWSPELSTGTYNLYRGTLPALAGLAYGGCRTSAIAATTSTDADAVVQGQGFFYLVTAKNLLAEEGTKGFRSSGTQRANGAPCP